MAIKSRFIRIAREQDRRIKDAIANPEKYGSLPLALRAEPAGLHWRAHCRRAVWPAYRRGPGGDAHRALLPL